MPMLRGAHGTDANKTQRRGFQWYRMVLSIVSVRSVIFSRIARSLSSVFFFQAEDGIRDGTVTGVQTCALPISVAWGIAQEMRRDPNVVFLGEDVAAAGGVFKTTVGLLEEFGPQRGRDTPISEQAILGAAVGAALTG